MLNMNLEYNFFKILQLAVWLSLFAQPNLAWGQYFHGTISNAMGGAGRSSDDGSQSVFLNPATLRMAPPVDISFLFQDGQASNSEHQTIKGVSLIDNTKEAAFAGGLQYLKVRRFFHQGTPVDGEWMQVSVADWLYKKLSVGLSLTRLTQSFGGQNTEESNFTLGFLNPINEKFRLAMVLENIAQENEDVPIELRLRRSLAFGFYYSWQNLFRFMMDVNYLTEQNPESKWNVSSGVESLFLDYLYFRFGYNSNNLYGFDSSTIGVGFSGPKLKVDYFYRKTANSGTDAMHGVDFRLVF
ncbi:MAG: hypothetical protein KDD50_08385 [Bdellovibrionales bacterium]|nr:hypothetical protein [Bdellovibrionales bacterium]